MFSMRQVWEEYEWEEYITGIGGFGKAVVASKQECYFENAASRWSSGKIAEGQGEICKCVTAGACVRVGACVIVGEGVRAGSRRCQLVVFSWCGFRQGCVMSLYVV